MITVYTYSSCDTCRRATRWLKTQGIEFQELPIRKTPPSVKQLKAALSFFEGDRRKLFNTSGRDYREQKLSETLPNLSDAAIFALLSANGNLVKRPFVVADPVYLAGFDEERWSQVLPSSTR